MGVNVFNQFLMPLVYMKNHVLNKGIGKYSAIINRVPGRTWGRATYLAFCYDFQIVYIKRPPKRTSWSLTKALFINLLWMIATSQMREK